eukprot:COSAG04_NODE_1592_length_6214_cov_4.841047_5_plen_201_part_00
MNDGRFKINTHTMPWLLVFRGRSARRRQPAQRSPPLPSCSPSALLNTSHRNQSTDAQQVKFQENNGHVVVKHGGGCGPKGAHQARGWVACPRQRRRRPLRCGSCPAASRARRSCAGRTEPANTEQMNVAQVRKVEKREGGGSLRVAKGGTCTAASGGTGRHSSTCRTDCASPTPSSRQPNQPTNVVGMRSKANSRATVEA